MSNSNLARNGVAVVLATLLCVACSSGSGSGGGSPDPGPGPGPGPGPDPDPDPGEPDEFDVLALYQFSIHAPDNDPLLVFVPGLGDSGGTLSLRHSVPGQGLTGTLSTENGEITIAIGSELLLEEMAETPELFGELTLTTTAAFVVPENDWATAGQLVVAISDDEVILTVNDEGTGVRLDFDEGANGVVDETVDLTWAEFGQLSDDAPFWQQLADFGYGAKTGFLFDLIEVAISGLELIGPDLQAAGTLVESCDAFSDEGWVVPPPPPVIPDSGLLNLTWFDDSGDGAVGSGDSFEKLFDYCLDTESGNSDLRLSNGTLVLANLVQEVDDGLLVRMALEGESATGRAGGIVFDDYELFEIDAGGTGGSTSIDDSVTINGRLILVFEAPDP